MDTRSADLQILREGLKSSDPIIRRDSKISGEKIHKQRFDHTLMQAREALVREKKQGRQDNARQISEDIFKHESRGFGRTSFTFSMPEHLIKKK